MKENLFIKFLYNTKAGRLLLKPLVMPAFSKVSAKLFSSRLSLLLVPWFIKKNCINMENIRIPDGGFNSFNDFFTRRIDGMYDIDPNAALVSPCDGLLTIVPIDDALSFNIKHTHYSLRQLINNDELALNFEGGTALIFRLTPSNYHRYLYCADGISYRNRIIKGKLHSVRPICHEKRKVFIQNSREYSVIFSPILGDIIQMEIGALLVGKISNYSRQNGKKVHIGHEKGFFEYGGSSIVVLLKDNIEIDSAILSRDPIEQEIPVRIGELLVKQNEKEYHRMGRHDTCSPDKRKK